MPEAARCFRDRYGGRSAIWIAFTPKPQSRPQTKDGEVLKKACGKARVGETDYQVIRVDIELIDDLSVGLGLLARIHMDTKLAFVRQKVNNEIWLPAEFRLAGSARVLLLRQLCVESTRVFTDYKKFWVSSIYELPGGKPPQ